MTNSTTEVDGALHALKLWPATEAPKCHDGTRNTTALLSTENQQVTIIFRVRRLTTKHTERRTLRSVDKNSDPIKAICGPKFMKFRDIVGDPSCFARLSMACVVQKAFAITVSLEVVQTSNKCKSLRLLAPIFGRDYPDFTVHRLAKCG